SLLPHSLSRVRAPLGAPSRRLPYGTGPRFSLAVSLGPPSSASGLPPSGGLTDAASGTPDGHPSAKLLAGGPYWPTSGPPAPPGCVLCGKHARGRRIRLHHQDASR